MVERRRDPVPVIAAVGRAKQALRVAAAPLLRDGQDVSVVSFPHRAHDPRLAAIDRHLAPTVTAVLGPGEAVAPGGDQRESPRTTGPPHSLPERQMVVGAPG